MKRTVFALCVMPILLALAQLSFAQVKTLKVSTGTPPFSSMGGGPFDAVNLGNLNVHFSIPVLHKAGRGIPFTYDLTYDNSVWAPVTSSGTTTWTPVNNWGWTGPTQAGTGYISYDEADTFPTQYCQVATYNNYVYHDAFGAPHAFPGKAVWQFGIGGQGCTSHFTGLTSNSSDDSAYTIKITNNSGTGSMTSKSGAQVGAPFNVPSGTGAITDSNGNKITVNGSGQFFDTLSSTTAVLTVSGSGTPASPTKFTYTAPSGANAVYTMNFTQYTVHTNFGFGSDSSPIHEYGATSVALVSSIALPDDTQSNPDKYTFTYEVTPGSCTPLTGTYQANCVTGRIASVTLPTGGTITYGYIGGTHSTGIYADGSTSGLTRVLGPSSTWQYVRSLVLGTPGPGSTWTTTITDPTTDANQTVINFAEDTATTNSTTTATYLFYETQRQVYQRTISPSNLLATTVRCYNGVYASCQTATVTSPIYTSDIYNQLPNGSTRASHVVYNGSFNGSGLVSDDQEYDFGVSLGSAPSSAYLKRETATGYASLGNGIVNRPALVTVSDWSTGAAITIASTTYTYDQGTVTTTTTPQHAAVTGSRGNVTTVSTQTTNTATLTKTFAYYDTGNLKVATDVNSAQTTYGYGANSCTNSFADSITAPISGLSSSFQWNCTGGVVTKATDANGNFVTTTYNDVFFWRPASSTDATQLNTTNYAYTNASSGVLASVESQMKFNSNNSIAEGLSTFDNLGRPQYAQQQEGVGSGNYDTTQAIYDSAGRLYQTTMPCVAASGQGCPSAAKTQIDHDGMGRVIKTTDGGTGYVSYAYQQNDVLQQLGPPPTGESLKQKQLEYDGLGRLKSVCEISAGLPGVGGCGQTVGYNGYLTTYAYGLTTINSVQYSSVTVTQNAQPGGGTSQTRLYVYDRAGRLIQETNPENGTTTYAYDSATGCTGPYNGDLVKKVDNKTPTPNVSCYAYDTLHRATGITYTGPDAANTPTKTFVYDGVTFNGTTMSNPKGRLVEAYTGASASKITDELFSYSVRGELTDTWECTPNSGANGCGSVSNYYKVTVGYWANGALNTLSTNISGLPNQTYGVDPMGRGYSVTAGSGQNPVSSTVYDLVNFKTSVTFGSSDSDVFNMDPHTGRMTNYQFTVGTTAGQNTDTGTIAWNSNGSLGSLAIVDQIPGTQDSQTCNFTHDDLSRISSAGCGTSWNQTFTYDAFGNITKNATVGTTFTPTYSPSTNWITNLPGCTPTTDADGRMTYDCVHNYGWDVEGKMISVDSTACGTNGTCTTYDALGRMVENNVSGAYTQIVYSPIGRFALMNGQSLLKAFVPLPTGATAVYTTLGLAYYRHADHLGSARLASNPSRTLYSSTAYAPFGEPYSQAGTTDLSFTGQDQDTVSGMHDFPMRKLVPVQGRWLSPDPAGLAATDKSSPQSFNRYAYVRNSPLTFTDPLGLNIDYKNCVGDGREAAGCNGGGGCNSDVMDCGSSGGSPSSPGDWGTTYSLDGLSASASTVQWLMSIGAAAQCPDNNCGPRVGANGYFYSLSLDQEGWSYINPSNGASFENGSELGLAALPDEQATSNTSGDAANGSQLGGGNSNGACTGKVLSAVNNHFGTNFTEASVTSEFQFSTGAPPGQGTLNLNISGGGVSPGRSPVNWWSYIIGYGSTLHIPAGPGGLDSSSTLVFSSSQFTAHLDSAFPYNPFGAVFHLLIDVKGMGGYKACP